MAIGMAACHASPLGAVLTPEGVRLRVWAPRARQVAAVVGPDPESAPTLALQAEPEGFWAGLIPGVGAGTLYRFRLDGRELLLPDPASRFQPQGPLGPSQVVDPQAFGWTDASWRGPALRGQVLYELHLGTFTPEGTWSAALPHLDALADLGITLIELMPLAEQPGRFGWGYDGVGLFAPYHAYGAPDDMRRFVDRAHALGIGVILDVVYNHLGPTGNVLREFSACYFSTEHQTEWGEAINFDAEGCGPVRQFVLENAAHWIEAYHLDGLRLDATQAFFDASQPHILAEITARVKAVARQAGRQALVIGENEPQDAALLRPADAGGLGLDALWADDFHHVGRVLATGRREAYYADYQGTASELAALLRDGWLYQGQFNARQGKPRGTRTTGLEPWRFVHFLQNHDQVANALSGARLHQETDPATVRALTALLLLGPATPLLFMGQEFAASSPFLYFGDQPEEIAALVRQGRREFLSQFASLAQAEAADRLADPAAPATRDRSVLDHRERFQPGPHAQAWALHRDLLRLRRTDPVLSAQADGGIATSVLGPLTLLARLRALGGDERLLVLNLGPQCELAPLSEPLLAPPVPDSGWSLVWSSEHPDYGGHGTPPPVVPGRWRLPARSALWLAPTPTRSRETEPDRG